MAWVRFLLRFSLLLSATVVATESSTDEGGEQGWGKSEEFDSERPHGPIWHGDVPHLWVGGRLGLCVAGFSRPRVPVAEFTSLIIGGCTLSKDGEGDLTGE